MYFLIFIFCLGMSLLIYVTHGKINNDIAYVVGIIAMILCTALGAASLVAGIASLTDKTRNDERD